MMITAIPTLFFKGRDLEIHDWPPTDMKILIYTEFVAIQGSTFFQEIIPAQ